MGTHPIFESDFDCLTEREQIGSMAYLVHYKPDVSRKTWRCPNTGMMMVKDVYKYPGVDLVGRQHVNQRNRDGASVSQPVRHDPVLTGHWMNSAARTLVHDEAPDISKYELNLNAVSNKGSLGMFDHAIVKPGELKATPQMSSPNISIKTSKTDNSAAGGAGCNVDRFRLWSG